MLSRGQFKLFYGNTAVDNNYSSDNSNSSIGSSSQNTTLFNDFSFNFNSSFDSFSSEYNNNQDYFSSGSGNNWNNFSFDFNNNQSRSLFANYFMPLSSIPKPSLSYWTEAVLISEAQAADNASASSGASSSTSSSASSSAAPAAAPSGSSSASETSGTTASDSTAAPATTDAAQHPKTKQERRAENKATISKILGFDLDENKYHIRYDGDKIVEITPKKNYSSESSSILYNEFYNHLHHLDSSIPQFMVDALRDSNRFYERLLANLALTKGYRISYDPNGNITVSKYNLNNEYEGKLKYLINNWEHQYGAMCGKKPQYGADLADENIYDVTTYDKDGKEIARGIGPVGSPRHVLSLLESIVNSERYYDYHDLRIGKLDDKGRITEIRDRSGNKLLYSILYNETTGEVSVQDNSAKNFTHSEIPITYKFNSKGNLTKMAVPFKNNHGYDRYLVFSEDGTIKEQENPTSHTALKEYSYDKEKHQIIAREKSRRYENGTHVTVYSLSGNVIEEYEEVDGKKKQY